MAILIDTNILLRLLQPHHPHFPLVERALVTLRMRNEPLNIMPQNLMEFWAVATRPTSENGLGMTVENAAGELASMKRVFTLLAETASVYQEWERLVLEHQVSGKNSHDAHIVAAMNIYGITRILTFNVQDFARYSGISAVNPADVG
jgi:predicted nucleic acid-binding protein